jgi:chaperonin GroEL (HSP60 family)
MNPQIVIRGYKKALEFCLKKLEDLIIPFDNTSEKRREMLIIASVAKLKHAAICLLTMSSH